MENVYNNKAAMGVDHVESLLYDINNPLGSERKCDVDTTVLGREIELILSNRMSEPDMLNFLNSLPKLKNAASENLKNPNGQAGDKPDQENLELVNCSPGQKLIPIVCSSKSVSLPSLPSIRKAPSTPTTSANKLLNNIASQPNSTKVGAFESFALDDQQINSNDLITLTLQPVTDSHVIKSKNINGWKGNTSLAKTNPVKCSASPELIKTFISQQQSSFIPKNGQYLSKTYRNFTKNTNLKSPSNAASAKLEALANMRKGLNGSSEMVKDKTSLLLTKCNLQSVVGRKGKMDEEKSRFFGISDHYIKYLNKPKMASHIALKIIFKAIPLPDPIQSLEIVKRSPTGLFYWPSGKETLPGYKGCKRVAEKVDSIIASKRRKIVSQYRVPKPKPKVDFLTMQRFPGNLSRKPVWVQSNVKKPKITSLSSKFVPFDKLKWDPKTRKFVVPTQPITCKTAKNSRWFTFPSTKQKTGTTYLSHFRNKITTIGTPNAASRQQNLVSTPRLFSKTIHKNVPSSLPKLPIKVPQNIKEIKVIFKCMNTPMPQQFEKYEDYVKICILYHVRRTMAAKALRTSYIEGKNTKLKKGGKEENGSNQSTPQKNEHTTDALNSIVLISCQTELALSSWASKLPQAEELDKIHRKLPTSKIDKRLNTPIAADWLFTCSGDVVEYPIRRKLPPLVHDKQNQLLFTQATNAWKYDELDFIANKKSLGNTSITKHTGGPSYTTPSITSPLTVDLSGSCKKNVEYDMRRKDKKVSNVSKGERYPKMQRSMSKVKMLNRERASVKKSMYGTPKPSYCVRFRECFCSYDCSCGAACMSLTHSSEIVIKKTSIPSDPRLDTFMINRSRSDNCNKYSNKVTVVNSLDHCGVRTGYDIGCTVLKTATKWDMKSSSRKKAECLHAKSVANHSLSGQLIFRARELSNCDKKNSAYHSDVADHTSMYDMGMARKIGNTEIYHQWGIRRFSSSSVNYNRIPDMSQIKPKKYINATEIIHRKGVKRRASVDDVNSPETETKKFALDVLLPDGGLRGDVESMNSTATAQSVGLICADFDKPLQPNAGIAANLFPHCLYAATKYETSIMAKSRLCLWHNERRHYAENERELLFTVQEKGVAKANNLSSLLQTSAGNIHDAHTPPSINNGKPLLNKNKEREPLLPIGSHKYSDIPHVKVAQADQSLSNSVEAGALVSKEVRGSWINQDEEMGNRLYKPTLLQNLSSVIAPEFVGKESFNGSSGRVSPAQANVDKTVEYRGNAIKMGVKNHTKLNSRYEMRDLSEDSIIDDFSFENKQHDFDLDMDVPQDISSIYLEDTIDMTVDAEFDVKMESDDIFNTDMCDETTGTVLPAVSAETRVHCEQISEHGQRKSVKKDVEIEPTTAGTNSFEIITEVESATQPLNTETQQIASGDQPNDLPIETRSSHRLRSRVGKKRCRYESDYVTDIPKAAKKPKLPTRDYDNDGFWQFYRDAEKTVHAKNLALQYKYIKLFKSKEINCKVLPQFAGIQSQYNNVLCSSTYLSKTEPTLPVPLTGLPDFMTRYTKSKKATPDLPKVEAGHCPYCGRSFVDESEDVLDSHINRHNMSYTILSAPVLAKKKKKSKTARKDSALRKPKPHESTPTTIVVVDPLSTSDTKLPTFSNETPSALTTSHYQNFDRLPEQVSSMQPMARPSHITMGHRKQTARKSFNITSTMPKEKLIAALACKMRLSSPTHVETPPTNVQIIDSTATLTKKKSAAGVLCSPTKTKKQTVQSRKGGATLGVAPATKKPSRVTFPSPTPDGKSPEVQQTISLTKCAKSLPNGFAVSEIPFVNNVLKHKLKSDDGKIRNNISYPKNHLHFTNCKTDNSKFQLSSNVPHQHRSTLSSDKKRNSPVLRKLTKRK